MMDNTCRMKFFYIYNLVQVKADDTFSHDYSLNYRWIEQVKLKYELSKPNKDL